MDRIGIKLRAIRQKCGFTLREVENRSLRISEHWGDPSYRVSASWLDRVERENRTLSGTKLIVLGAIYSLSSEELLALYTRDEANSIAITQLTKPNNTLLLTRGPLAEYAHHRLPESVLNDPIPEETMLLPPEDYLPAQYRRGVIGMNDQTLEPMVRAGTFVLIDTKRRAIAHRREWSSEYNRPIYFLYTHAGYVCGWCDLDRNTDWLTLVPHYASYTPSRRWKYRVEVEVIGRVAAMLQRFEQGSVA
ncbi:MAG: XRE family transcriptional regulator [Silvibacterium sp.]